MDGLLGLLGVFDVDLSLRSERLEASPLLDLGASDLDQVLLGERSYFTLLGLGPRSGLASLGVEVGFAVRLIL